MGVAAACAVAYAGFAWAKRYSKIREQFAFELLPRLNSQENNQRQLEQYCLNGYSKHCFSAVASSAAWNSRLDSQAMEKLEFSCLRRNKQACVHLSAIMNIKGKLSGFWSSLEMSGTLFSPPDAPWPRILTLNNEMNYRRWIELSYAAMLTGKGSRWDMICGRTVEFPDALVCAAMDGQKLNASLGRIAYLVEQANAAPLGSVNKDQQVLLSRFWQGYDLLRSDFDAGARRLESEGQVRTEEAVFWDFLRQKSWTFLIGFNVHSVLSGIQSHEFLHGIYFSSGEYRDRVAKAVTSSPFKMLPIVEFVGSLYKTSNKFVINNEIQAYAFQADFADSKNTFWATAVASLKSEVWDILDREPRWAELLRDIRREN